MATASSSTDAAAPAPGLAEILAPRSIDWLLGKLTDAEVEVVRGPAERLAGLLDWPMLREAAATGALPAGQQRITRANVALPAILYRNRGVINPAKLDELMDAGASFVANRVDQALPSIGAVAEAISAIVPESIRIGAIATHGPGGALDFHYDPEDILVVQFEGSKRWLVHGPPVPDPVRGMSPPEPPAGPPLLDTVIEAGDLLYVPAGYWHRCENGPGRSVHMGIAIRRPSAADLLCDLAERLRDEPLLRRPLTRIASPEERARHAAEVRALVAERVAALDFENPPSRMANRTTEVRRDED